MNSNATQLSDLVTYHANEFASLDPYLRVSYVSGFVEQPQRENSPYQIAYLAMAITRRLRCHYGDDMADRFESALYQCALRWA